MKRRIFLVKTGIGFLGIASCALPFKRIFNPKTSTKMNNRMSSFDVPHKGIRNALSQLSLLSGKTDYSDEKEVEKLYSLGKEVFLILTTHAHDENDVSLKALEEKVKGSSHHDMEEHEKIEEEQLQLEKMLETIYPRSAESKSISAEGKAFYQTLSEFHAIYLQHMAWEEKHTQKLLWDHFSDEELAGHRVEIMKNLKPDVLLLWFKFSIPALSHFERVALLKGFKANAPEAFFDQAMNKIQIELSEEEFGNLKKELK